jgi:beta-lactam-binding protein with PASTA domain
MKQKISPGVAIVVVVVVVVVLALGLWTMFFRPKHVEVNMADKSQMSKAMQLQMKMQGSGGQQSGQ